MYIATLFGRHGAMKERVGEYRAVLETVHLWEAEHMLEFEGSNPQDDFLGLYYANDYHVEIRRN